MSGIYIHIPFCKQACHYCNFHFSTSLKYKDEMLDAILHEIELQEDYLKGEEVSTIYFGGGTPSLLSADEVLKILEKINQFHKISTQAEITLEANPDDLTADKIQTLKETPINRFSIGVQSFHAVDLKFMNRAHNAEEALKCIKEAQDAGFTNLTIDLIYGTPTMNDTAWRENLATAFDLNIPHLSSYALTVEPNTALDHFVKKGKVKPMDEEQAARQFELLVEQTERQGYEHYEISNFAKPNSRAVHNSNYWLGKSYLGIGPSAHSFNGTSRQWNIAHNMQYIKALEGNEIPYEIEHLSRDDQYNEYVMTGLRTTWGVSLERIRSFGKKYEQNFLKSISKYLENNLAEEIDGNYILTKAGKFKADGIASELFF